MTKTPLTQVQALLFDLDGTVVDNSQAHYEAWRQLLDSYGKGLDPAEYQQHYLGKNTEAVITTVWDGDYTQEEITGIYHKKLEIYSALLSEYAETVRGFHEFIAAAKQYDLPVLLVSNATPQSKATTLRALQLETIFQHTIGPEHGLAVKPNPAMYLHAAALIGVAPENCVVFEDSLLGIEAAAAAGMSVVGLATTHQPEDLHHTHISISNYDQLHIYSDEQGVCIEKVSND